MDNKKQHRTNTQIENDSKKLFSEGNVVWEKSKEEVWENTFAKLQETSGKKVHLKSRIRQLSVAASLAVLLGSVAFFWFYSKTINCPAGKHLAVNLPDGSIVNLNANSQLSYKPFAFYVSRELKFEGEAFFQVEKGKKFVVKSAKASTQVLGTTFNIFTHDGEYKVSCLTGKVKVSSSVKNAVILHPNDHAEVDNNGLINLTNNYNTTKEVSWQKNEFFFTGTLLSKVINELERQYGVSIKMSPELDYNVSLNLNTKHNIEDVLEYVCEPSYYTFVKVANGSYTIIQNN